MDKNQHKQKSDGNNANLGTSGENRIHKANKENRAIQIQKNKEGSRKR